IRGRVRGVRHSAGPLANGQRARAGGFPGLGGAPGTPRLTCGDNPAELRTGGNAGLLFPTHEARGSPAFPCPMGVRWSALGFCPGGSPAGTSSSMTELGVQIGSGAAVVGASAIGLCAYSVFAPRSQVFFPVISRGDGSAPGRVALTFDDGPGPSGTMPILDSLGALGVQAAF